MLTFILKIFSYIRKMYSPIFWKIMQHFVLAHPEHDYWSQVKKHPLEVFNAMMSSIGYKPDPLFGLLDYTLEDPNYYFFVGNDGNYFMGKDCDDAAFIWYKYLIEQIFIDEVYVILAMDGIDIRTMHFFTVGKLSENKFKVFNYKIMPHEFKSLEDACSIFSQERCTSTGIMNNMHWIIYKSWKR